MNPMSVAEPERLLLVLYVAQPAANSVRAVENLRAYLERTDQEADLEIIDVLQNPDRASSDRVVVTPTLIRLRPAPVVRLIGDLQDEDMLSKILSASFP
jgi:circadian clock protein KaiB